MEDLLFLAKSEGAGIRLLGFVALIAAVLGTLIAVVLRAAVRSKAGCPSSPPLTPRGFDVHPGDVDPHRGER